MMSLGPFVACGLGGVLARMLALNPQQQFLRRFCGIASDRFDIKGQRRTLSAALTDSPRYETSMYRVSGAQALRAVCYAPLDPLLRILILDK